ncbi:CoA transferase [Pelagibius litoralis]|uniref:CoA transferase n=1 Tax=Pelagibius litoralis TaxID=374515 RepID=A0A967EWZ3_9PROT|nr:CaiB/BaiF CoA-transferase family protein [Pelagibius litoralis]NIA69063.1 CoA transferase [Pelagibius litoralis]
MTQRQTRPLGGSLDGLLVVSLEQAVAAPYCSCRLADAGARVIKLERPEGDFARAYDRAARGESAYFVWLNRGKESIAVDLKTPEDLALVKRMIAKADIFIQNLAPGAAQRLGLGSDELREADPRLITCDISGYGDSGPYAQMKAYDLLVQAESGLASITGRPEGPGRVGVSVCDIACGMYAYQAVLEALLRRARTGEGAGLAASLFSGMADWMTVPLLHHDYGPGAPQRVGLNHPSIAPYGVYPCAAGEEIVICIQNEREWLRFVGQVLKQPDLAEDPRFCDNTARVDNRAALDREIESCFTQLDRAALVDLLHQAGIAFGAVNSPADLSAHPQLRRVTVETPGGPVDLVAPPVEERGVAPLFGSVPALDAQGTALRKEFGA